MADPNLMTGLGAAFSIFFASIGASVASVPAGSFLLRSNCGFKSFAPIMIAGVLAIYGMIMAVILVGKMNTTESLNTQDGYRYFTAGLSVGFACLASGFGLSGFVGSNLEGEEQSCSPPDESQEGLLRTRRTSAPIASLKFLSVCVFLEAIGLYGLIVGLIIAG